MRSHEVEVDEDVKDRQEDARSLDKHPLQLLVSLPHLLPFLLYELLNILFLEELLLQGFDLLSLD
jgi:hypothetical protein